MWRLHKAHTSCNCHVLHAWTSTVPQQQIAYASCTRRLQQPCRASSADDAAPAVQSQAVTEEVLQKLCLLQRQLDVAVAKEDYVEAKQLKDQADVLRQQLSPVQQYVQHQLEKLRKGTTADKAAAIRTLGDVGGEECLPGLAGCLADAELTESAGAAMWAVFARHPSPEVALLMQQGASFLGLNQLPLALEAFEAAAKLAPSFAEAHNQRATVLFLMEDFKQSIEVCRLVLDLNPYHFGAASGMGLCHLRLRDYQGALRAFEQALQIHPGLSNAQHFVAEIKEKLAAEEGQQQ